MRLLTIILLLFSLSSYSQSVKIDGPTGKASDLTTNGYLEVFGTSNTDGDQFTIETLTLTVIMH